jgi:hypothetical protein
MYSKRRELWVGEAMVVIQQQRAPKYKSNMKKNFNFWIEIQVIGGTTKWAK